MLPSIHCLGLNVNSSAPLLRTGSSHEVLFPRRPAWLHVRTYRQRDRSSCCKPQLVGAHLFKIIISKSMWRCESDDVVCHLCIPVVYAAAIEIFYTLLQLQLSRTISEIRCMWYERPMPICGSRQLWHQDCSSIHWILLLGIPQRSKTWTLGLLYKCACANGYLRQTKKITMKKVYSSTPMAHSNTTTQESDVSMYLLHRLP